MRCRFLFLSPYWFLHSFVLSPIPIASYMLSRAGAWLDGSSPVDSAAYQQFTSWVAAGYESAGASLVDRAELDRSYACLRILTGSRFCFSVCFALHALSLRLNMLFLVFSFFGRAVVLLRRTFYDRFCHRALRELDADAAYEARAGPMRGFMQWVAEWCDRENASDAAAAAASSQGQ
jgi:hypothetical protein